MRILIFGDSITYGAWDLEGGWAARLRKFLDKKVIESNFEFYCLTYNLGISGDTSRDILKRFEFETKIMISERDRETIFIFAIGANDAAFSRKNNVSRVSLEKFQSNLYKLINLARKFSSKIIFCGLLPVDEIKTTPISWNGDISYKNAYIQEYNEVLKSVCGESGIYFIDILDKIMKEPDYKNLLEDGAHPNSMGHQKIFKMVKNFLLENEII